MHPCNLQWGMASMMIFFRLVLDSYRQIKRFADKTPIWNKEYEAFQTMIGFKTKLCKVAHPFTKGFVNTIVM